MKIKHYTILALFALAGALTFFCRSDERHVKTTRIDLTTVPESFGDWHMIKQDANLKAKEAKFLDDVLFRTYERKDGKCIILAIAYGTDQRKKFTIHMPEVCYKGAGCNVTSIGQATMPFPGLTLRQMLAKNPDGGLEAVQYWIVLGGRQVTSEFERKLKRAYYGFFGADAGGVLVRVSSASNDRYFRADYEVQQDFISALYKSLAPELMILLFGHKI